MVFGLWVLPPIKKVGKTMHKGNNNLSNADDMYMRNIQIRHKKASRR